MEAAYVALGHRLWISGFLVRRPFSLPRRLVGTLSRNPA